MPDSFQGRPPHQMGDGNSGPALLADREPQAVIVLRDQYQRAAAGRHFESNDIRELLQKVIEHPVHEFTSPVLQITIGDATILDVDVRGWDSPPTTRELETVVAGVYPQPNAWWTTHGMGLKLVYAGGDHKIAAAAATLSLPQDFEIEMKRDSRHPAGGHPERPGAKCGPVTWTENPRPGQFNWGLVGSVDEKTRKEVLDELELELHGRYDHDRCLIAGHEQSSAEGCVWVRGEGVFCFRCAAKGVRLRSGLAPGWVPYAELDGVANTTIMRLARHHVHWEHARYELAHEHPNISADALRMIHSAALDALHGTDDPRNRMAFNADLRIVLGEGMWLDGDTFEPMDRLSDDTHNSIPGLYDMERKTMDEEDEEEEEEEETVQLVLRGPRRDRARAAKPLKGYKPVRIIRGISFAEKDRDVVPVVLAPKHGGGVELVPDKDLLSEDECFRLLGKDFPGINPNYVRACLDAMICAEKGGRPPMIMCVGPTGSGKGATPALVATLLGDHLIRLSLDMREDEPFWRSLGSALVSGHRAFQFDELNKIRGLGTKMRKILEISGSTRWRPLYKTASISTPTRAAFFITTAVPPDVLVQSAEFCRRTWMLRLHDTVRDWGQSSGGDIEDWRNGE